MTDLSFDFEWVDPQGARGDELRATWASLEIRVGDAVVTRMVDTHTKSLRERIFVPLYPMAEWFAVHWWRLLHEVEIPRHSPTSAYRNRHCLSSAGEGFALPPLMFEPLGENLRLSWEPRQRRHSPVEFVGEGSALLALEAVEEALRRLIGAVVDRLDDLDESQTPLHCEWQAILALDSEEKDFCRIAAAVGLDPFQMEKARETKIIEAVDRLPSEIRDEFFYCSDIERLDEEVDGIGRALKEASHAAEEGKLEGLVRLRHSLAPDVLPAATPWREGYRLARSLREKMGLDGQPLDTFEKLAKALDVESGALDRGIREVGNLSSVDGLVGYDGHESPGFVLREARESSRRFTFCRELFEYLVTPPQQPSIVTKSGTGRQKRNRAFAAELLLPSKALRCRVSGDRVSSEEIEEIADEFGVSSLVVSHQVENHCIARVIAD